ncbi:MAG: hypothetical protein O7A08_10520, partial [SAR324 cluster bacterium]|nr:hypothetical protein [SAR324 cluster bacterium]
PGGREGSCGITSRASAPPEDCCKGFSMRRLEVLIVTVDYTRFLRGISTHNRTGRRYVTVRVCSANPILCIICLVSAATCYEPRKIL